MIKIAVIGAGMTGLTIAHHLKHVAQVQIFEKSRGLGGRMATRRSDNTSFDHGAQYFVAKSTEFKAFLQEPLSAGVISEWRARFQEIDGRTGATLAERTWDDGYPHYVGTPSMNALVKYLSMELEVHRETQVAKIDRTDNHLWCLRSDQNAVFGQYDWVILTCPPEQAAALLPHSCSFKSDLSNIELLPCYAVMLAFDNPCDLRFDAALIRHADISWVAQNNTKPKRGACQSVVIQSNNEWAKDNLERDIDGVKSHLIEETQRVLGVDLGQAVHSDIHRWKYANTIIQRTHHGDVFIDTTLGLGAAGDWCGNARVESAFLHGKKLAEAVLHTLKCSGIGL